jgi:hypothetical protein
LKKDPQTGLEAVDAGNGKDSATLTDVMPVRDAAEVSFGVPSVQFCNLFGRGIARTNCSYGAILSGQSNSSVKFRAPLIDFQAIDSNCFWRANRQPNLVTAGPYYFNSNIFTDDDFFADPPGQH